MHFLITNDDGIDAPGILALENALKRHENISFTVMAPDRERSACSHSMSLNRPVQVEQRDATHYAHTGTVADGVFIALNKLLMSVPDMVISGINAGANLGQDVFYSGTVAGAREGAFHNIPGMAVSLVCGQDWDPVAHSCIDVALKILSWNQAPAVYNLNYPKGQFLPPMPAILGRRRYEHHIRMAGAHPNDGYLLGGAPVAHLPDNENTDVSLIARGVATLTPLALDQTNHSALLQICL